LRARPDIVAVRSVGHNGGFTGMGQQSAQQVLGGSNFAAEAQQLHAFSGLQDGFVKLA